MLEIRPPKYITASAIAFLAWSLCGSAALAQAQTGTSAQELNPVQRAPLPAETSRGDLLAPPETGPCPLRGSALTFVLNSVTFNGAHTVGNDELAAAYEGLIGKTVPVSALCDIRDRASSILFHKGLFARVEIPEQKISKGHVEFDVIEAFISRVRVLGDDSAAQSKVEDYIERLRGMRPFNIELAQRYLYLASDVPGVALSATLKPAGHERGAVELDVTIVSRKAIDALVNVENFGSESVGPFGSLFRADFNSFTSFGERTTLVAYQTFDIKEQRVVQGLEEFRLGSDGLLGNLSFSAGKTQPGSILSPLQLKSSSTVGDVNLAYPMIRERYVNLTFAGGMEVVDEKVDAGSSPLSRDHLRVLYARASGNDTFRGDIPTNIHGNLEVRQGVDWFGASHLGNPLLSIADGDPDALLVRMDGGINFGPVNDFTGNLNFSGQYSGKPLLTYEQQAIGNFTIGRGYDPASLNGDRAAAASAEIHWAPMPTSWLVTAAPYLFYDTARVWNLTAGSQQREARSLGLGFVFRVTSHFQFDTFYAHPMDRISTVTSRRPPDRAFLNATIAY